LAAAFILFVDLVLTGAVALLLDWSSALIVLLAMWLTRWFAGWLRQLVS
jgi:hypothetical protein